MVPTEERMKGTTKADREGGRERQRKNEEGRKRERKEKERFLKISQEGERQECTEKKSLGERIFIDLK